MIINGFLKMTLLDFPGHVACTLFTAGCNMRCPFCHNASLVTRIHPEETIAREDIIDFLKKRQGLLDGVAISGGEPLLHDDLADFIREVRALGYTIKLDTNGTFPDKLAALIESDQIDYVAMDLKNCFEKYAETVGIPSLDITPIKESIRILMKKKVTYEFRTTVVRQFHDIDSIKKAASQITGADRYFLQAFTDSGNLIGENMTGVPKEEMLQMAQAAKQYIPNVSIRGI